MFLTKRVLPLLLSLLVVFSTTGFSAEDSGASTVKDDKNVASITFGDEVKKNKFDSANLMQNKPVVVSQEAGKSGWLLGVGTTGTLYMGLNKSFASQVTDGTRFTIEVDYYSRSAQGIYLIYDSATQADRSTENHITGVSERTNKWLTASFELDDAYFGDRIRDGYTGLNYDFSIKCQSDKEIIISEVRVIKHEENRPLNISVLTTAELGNVFGNDDAKTFNYTVVNNTDKVVKGSTSYYIYDEYENVVWSEDGGEISLLPNEEIKGTKTVDTTIYGLYDFEMEIKGEDYNIRKRVPFSGINSLPEGEVNKYYGVNIHPVLGSADLDDIVVLLNKSGSGILRAAEGDWMDFVGNDNDDFNPNATMQRIYSKLKETNVKIMPGMKGHTRYDVAGGPKGETRMITTDEEFNARRLFNVNYSNYVKSLGIEIGSWSLWNEPNLPKYNLGTVEETTDFVVKMAKALKEDTPDIPVKGIGLTQLESSTSKKLWKEAVDKGLLNYIDYMDGHYYYRARPETSIGSVAYQEYHDGVKAKIGKDLPMVMSEYGFKSFYDEFGSDKRVAEISSRVYLWHKGMGLSDYFIRYTLYDNYRSWSEFGMMLSPDSWEYIRYLPKDEFVTQVNINNMLQDADVERRVLENEDNKCAFIFRRPRDNAQVMPVWAYEGNAILSFKCDAQALSLADIYGNKKEITPVDGVYTIGLSESAQYLEGNLDNLQVVASPIGVDVSETLDVSKGSTARIKMNKFGASFDGMKVNAIICDETGTLSKTETELAANSNIKLPTADVNDYECVIRLTGELNGKEVLWLDVPLRLNVESGITAQCVLGSLKSKNDLEHAKLKFYITNNNAEPIDGYIRVNEPKGFADSIISFKTIPGKSTAIVESSTHSWSKFRDIDIKYDVIAAGMDKHSFENNLSAIYLLRAEKTPVIDGIISDGEYNMDTAYSFDSKENTVLIDGFDWEGPSDQSVTGVITYDEDNLYMVIDVLDDTFCVDGSRDGNTMWMYDSLQLGFASSSVWTSGDVNVGGLMTQIDAAELQDGTLWFDRSTSEKNIKQKGPIENSEFAVTHNGKHTIYELRLGWDELVEDMPKITSETTFLFSFLVNDNDGAGRKGWIELTPGIGMTKDPTQFCILSFVE